ncbi:DUF4374 domain-containing protein [Chitinophaga qingshengii]|uniref:DUF4374 domain-containing protein n=1 Tax=Chitinophaga qingshengii TaxID=1569794 RepID=A0ABR7TNV5_9BACT|nr:DUF4374 domain-containing protein [Chitinophaga qingshengii]MBC9932153.1 DUF4374 domain-containing protein [Chitinophaga qingshengii]
MKKISKYWLLAAGIVFFMSACDKDNTLGTEDFQEYTPQGRTKYIITATPVGTTGIADYLLTADDVNSGSVSTSGNGKEQDGSYRYYLTHKGRFFSLLYGQGNPGDVTTYRLTQAGKLVLTRFFQAETVQVLAKVQDELLLMKVPRSGNENASFYRIDALKSRVNGEKQVNIVQLAANGERAHFTWATQVGNKVFAPYMSIKGCCGDAFGTAYPDSSWIAVFSYPDLHLEKVIRDNRTSFIGNYFTNGLAVTENGDVYGYSSAAATNSSKYISTKPSAIVRVLQGTTEFDQSYFFNVQEQSGGYRIASQLYLAGNKMLLMMYDKPGAFKGDLKLAMVDLVNKTFEWVKGAPQSINSISAPYNNNTLSDDGKTAFIGLNTPSGNWIYKIDIAAATVSRGMKVEGGTITAITKMIY